MITVSSREQVYTAFFNHIQADAGITSRMKTFTRRLKLWTTVAKEDQPALYMEHAGESTSVIRGLPSAHVLDVNLWVYVGTDENETGPILNPILDAIDASLAPTDAGNGQNTQTLGGLVHHCWIEGQTQIFEGNLGDEAVAIVPVKILVT
jgi:hypothetical protein